MALMLGAQEEIVFKQIEKIQDIFLRDLVSGMLRYDESLRSSLDESQVRCF
jgi:hypothetical protein